MPNMNPWLAKLRCASDEELERIASARDNLSGDTPIDAIYTAQHLQIERKPEGKRTGAERAAYNFSLLCSNATRRHLR